MDLKFLKSQWDRTTAIVLTVVGAISLIMGFAGVADSAILAEQTRYIVSGGIGGIFLLGLGATLWISADLRDEWGKLDRIEQALAHGLLKWSDETATSTSGAHRATSSSKSDDESTDASAGLLHVASAREHA